MSFLVPSYIVLKASVAIFLKKTNSNFQQEEVMKTYLPTYIHTSIYVSVIRLGLDFCTSDEVTLQHCGTLVEGSMNGIRRKHSTNFVLQFCPFFLGLF